MPCIRRQRLALQAAALLMATALPGVAAGADLDCRAIGHDGVPVELATAAEDTRRITLQAAESLRFSFDGTPGPFGTLRLTEGPGAPRLLLVGPAGTQVSFTAGRAGAFTFQFERQGEDAARFLMSCGATDRRAAAAPLPLAPDPLPLADGTIAGEELQLGGADAPQGSKGRKTRSPLKAPAGAGIAIAAPGSPATPQMTMHWLDQRYAAGPNGLQVDGNTSGVEIGVNYKVKSAVTIGALAQLNPAAEVTFGAERSFADQGWMVGPVTTLHLAPGLLLDARAAWGEGQSGPDEAAGTAAQRRLLSARLANEQKYGAWRVTPSVTFNYLEETLRGLMPAAEAATPHATASGRVDLGPELAYHMELPSAGFIEPHALVGGFWDFDSLSKVGPSGAPGSEMRLKAEAGVTIGVRDGPKLEALGALEGGDRETPDAWTGRLQLSVPLK